MSETVGSLGRKIKSAEDLQSVVRTMKALAASSVGQYEDAVRALGDYHRAVELGLSVCFRQLGSAREVVPTRRAEPASVSAIVFGSDQGLVGQFNERIADYTMGQLALLARDLPPGGLQLWAVGERVHARLEDAGLRTEGLFAVPTSVKAIAPLVGQLQLESEARRDPRPDARVFVFYQRPLAGGLYEPVHQRLLPLDSAWRAELAALPWPTTRLPDLVHTGPDTLRTLIREFLFISLYRACAESLASENTSRLTAMERADRNIDELLATMNGTFHRLRQESIDEELFDVIAGYEALGGGS